MRSFIFALIAALLLIGCASHLSQTTPVCRHEAAASCFAAHEGGRDSYIAFGPVNGKPSSWHSQSFVLVNGERQWLNRHSQPGSQDNFTPQKVYSYREYLEYLLSH
jgi:hypothetical protein